MALYNKLSDSELIVLLKEEDEVAFTVIYNRYWALLYSHARRILRDDEEAMDVVQDVFAGFWTKTPELVDSSSLKAYLYTATRNKTIKLINRRKLKDNYLESLVAFMENGEFVSDDQIAFKEFIRQVEQEVANLPPKMRRVFEMSRNFGFSHRQIAGELSISEHAVKKTIYRALKVLKTQLSLFFFFFFL